MKNLSEIIKSDCKEIANKINFSELKDKSILITGASGLIGHYLVACLDNAARIGIMPSVVFLVTQNPLPEYFSDLTKNLPVKYLLGDLTDDSFLSGFPKANYIIHAAGYGQPGKFMSDPLKTIKLNTVCTLKTLDKLETDGKYLFLSTSEVYNGLIEPPFKEEQIGNTTPDNFRACYIEGKRCGEAIINAFREKGINAKSARLSLAYGPGTRRGDARVINNFIEKAIHEKAINLLDDGQSMRTYLYVTDAVEIMFNILFFGKQNVYNLGGNSRISIKKLAELVGEHLNVAVNLPLRSIGIAGAPGDVFLDMHRVEKEFHFKSFVPLEIGLERTITWQKELYL